MKIKPQCPHATDQSEILSSYLTKTEGLRIIKTMGNTEICEISILIEKCGNYLESRFRNTIMKKNNNKGKSTIVGSRSVVVLG